LLARYLVTPNRKEAGVWIQELFRRNYAKVVSWCLRFAGDREEARDLAQAIFAKAYRQFDSFRGDSKFSTWLYAITRSECMNFLQARKGRPAPAGLDELEHLAGGASPEQTLELEGSAQVVRALLEQALDDREREVFTLHYRDDLPLETITRLLGLSNRSGAKAYVVSARRKLARAVRAWKAREARDHEARREGGSRGSTW
jgi:RNA polymerase sigma-70 factor (ECF subfamily)